MQFVFATLVALITGVLSGWGVGGGSLLLVYMSGVAGIAQQTAQGINLIYFLPTSISALVSHIRNRLVDFSLAWPAIAAGVVSAALTAILVTGLDTSLLKKFFGVFIMIIGLSELLRKPDKKRRPRNRTHTPRDAK